MQFLHLETGTSKYRTGPAATGPHRTLAYSVFGAVWYFDVPLETVHYSKSHNTVVQETH